MSPFSDAVPKQILPRNSRSISGTISPQCLPRTQHLQHIQFLSPSSSIISRPFSTTSFTMDWLTPKMPEKSKSRVGRPRMPTGGSSRGTTVVWGDYGLRMRDHDRRISAKQLKIGEEAIRRSLRNMNYRLYTRVSANIGVYTSGNEVRMGKGKGNFDYWAVRCPVNRVVFELKGNMHERIVREAFRLAGNKLPGLWEFVKKGDPPVVGMTKLQDGITLESLKLARRQPPPDAPTSDPIIPPMKDTPPATMSPSV